MLEEDLTFHHMLRNSLGRRRLEFVTPCRGYKGFSQPLPGIHPGTPSSGVQISVAEDEHISLTSPSL